MTPERIRRHNDERIYQPRIHSRRIRELYRISQKTGEAITVLVDRALQEFIGRRSSDEDQSKADDEEQEDLSDRTEDHSGF
jgi:hypothetical protein